jgi:hypothetical protein
MIEASLQAQSSVQPEISLSHGLSAVRDENLAPESGVSPTQIRRRWSGVAQT